MFLILFQGPIAAVVPPSTKFRRTLSAYGTRTGARQMIGSLLLFLLGVLLAKR